MKSKILKLGEFSIDWIHSFCDLCNNQCWYSSSDSRFAIILAVAPLAWTVKAADWIAATVFAAIARNNVVVSVLTFVTIATDDIRFALTIGGHLVTYWNTIFSLFSSRQIGWAMVTVSVWQSQWITKMSGQTLSTVWTSCVVDTFQTFGSRTIAIANGIWIDISVVVTSLAKQNWIKKASWISIIHIWTQLNFRISWTLTLLLSCLLCFLAAVKQISSYPTWKRKNEKHLNVSDRTNLSLLESAKMKKVFDYNIDV